MTILSQGQLLGLAQEVGLKGNAALVVSAIAMAESSGRTDAIGPVGEVGLWQIYLKAHPQYTKSQMLDPHLNAKAMYTISSGGTNWNPWTTYTNGAYRQYLNSNLRPVTISGSPNSVIGSSTSGGIATLSSTVKTNPASLTDVGSAWKYILAYTVAILIFVFIAKFEAGYNALYYLAVLFLILLFVTQSKFISEALKPITKPSQPVTVNQ